VSPRPRSHASDPLPLFRAGEGQNGVNRENLKSYYAISFLFSLNRPIYGVTPDLFWGPGTKTQAFLCNSGPRDKPW